MEFVSPRTSPFSSPTIEALLRRRVLAWGQETGLSPSIRVSVDRQTYNLHKSPLVLKSGYFKRKLLESPHVMLPENFPGGSQIFEKVAMFIYSYKLSFDPFSIAALCCAAAFLDMTEDYASGNLRERADLYLNQVVLQSWEDTLVVLQKCRSLLPWAEELLIVSRCIESLAFMACMEILDPEHCRDLPMVTLRGLANRPWSCEDVKALASQELWINDLISLPFEFFRRIIGSLRRQGMREKHISPVITFYANKWVLPKSSIEETNASDAKQRVALILTGIIELLPMGEKACGAIPMGFYFALLSKCLVLNVSDGSKKKLINHIVSFLYLARSEDFLLPEDQNKPISSSLQLQMMERIISMYLSSGSDGRHMQRTPSNQSMIVAELWDQYLTQIGVDQQMKVERFTKLIEIIPESDRECHDQLYQAINIFLMNHPELSTEEKTNVCKYLDCQRLSQEICIEAVQNDQMPLRVIVQALFAQQLHTQQAFKECSDSFRYAHCGEFSSSLTSCTSQLPKSQPLGESPYEPVDNESETLGASVGILMHDHIAFSELTKADYESTSFRIQMLEQELASLKKNLRCQNHSEDAQLSSSEQYFEKVGLDEGKLIQKRNSIGQTGCCIHSGNWASQRKYVSKVLKVFRKMNMIGRGKTKRKQKSAMGLSNRSDVCKSDHQNNMYDC